MAYTQSTADRGARGYVLGRSTDGPFLDENGTAQSDIAAAEVHPDLVVARSMARRRNAAGMPGGTWEAVPLPAEQVPDDDEPYDQARADENYRRLARQPA